MGWRKASVAILVGCISMPVSAQGFPEKPARFIIPFPPGGPTDIIGRLAATQLTAAWGMAVVVDNRPGAGGSLGAELCARAPADGYTMCMLTIAHSVAPALRSSLPYDPVKDFAHVTLLATTPSVLLVHPSLPIRNVRELIDFAKKRPNALNFATSGSGSSSHMLMELMMLSSGMRLVHVPYKGTGPALTDQIAGHVEVGFAAIVAALPHMKADKLRAIAVSTSERFAALPDTPTIAESGLDGFDGGSWLGVAFPAGTSRKTVDKTNADLRRLFGTDEMRGRMLSLGASSLQGTPEAFEAHVRLEVSKWAKVVKAAAIKVQ